MTQNVSWTCPEAQEIKHNGIKAKMEWFADSGKI
jgi:hypothetical protein